MAQNSVIQGMVILDMVVHHSLWHTFSLSSELISMQASGGDLHLEVAFGTQHP